MAAILADDNFKCIFLNENDRIPIRISLKFVPTSPIDNRPILVQVMAWRRTGGGGGGGGGGAELIHLSRTIVVFLN